jgi:hypothetical protein
MERKSIDQLDEESRRLGTLRATYRPSWSSLLMRFAIAGVGFLVVGYGVADARRPQVNENMSTAWWIGLSVFSAVILVFSIYFAWATVRKARKRVLVFAEGLIQAGRSDFVVVRWTEIATVWHGTIDYHYDGMKLPTVQRVTIQTQDGERLTFDSDLDNVSELNQTIQAEVTPHLLSRARERLETDGMVPFGRLSVCRDGLKRGNSLLAWNQIDRVELRKGFITIRQKGKWRRWLKMRTSDFPNLTVFLPLVDGITGGTPVLDSP